MLRDQGASTTSQEGTGINKSNEPRYGNCQEQRAKKVRELSKSNEQRYGNCREREPKERERERENKLPKFSFLLLTSLGNLSVEVATVSFAPHRPLSHIICGQVIDL